MGVGLVCGDKQENMLLHSRFGARKERKDSPKIEALEVGKNNLSLLNMIKAGKLEVEKARPLEVLKRRLQGSWYHWQNRS